MPLSGTSKHDLFHDLNLTHHVSDVRHGSDAFLRTQQAIMAEFFEEPGGGVGYTIKAHSGMAYKKRDRSFELNRSSLFRKYVDSGETTLLENPIYVLKVPYEYYLTATASGSLFTSAEDENGRRSIIKYRGSATYELNDDGDGFRVASNDFESQAVDKFGDAGDWAATSSVPPSVLTYSNRYTDEAAKAHVDFKLASKTWGDWSEVADLSIGNINEDFLGSRAEIGAQVFREESEYQFFINIPPSLSTKVEWYEAEYNNYINNTADSLKVADGGQIIRGGFVSGSGDFQGLVGYINELDNPTSLDSRVRFTATVSELKTGEYQHEKNEYLLGVDEVFELFARFRSGGEEVSLIMSPINQALSSPFIDGAFTFNAELIYVNCPSGQSVDFLKVGQNNLDFSSSRLKHYWKAQKMLLDVYFRVGGYESVIGSIPMTGGRLTNPVITGYRNEAEPEGFPVNMEYQEFEAAGTSTLTPIRKNYACVKAVPTGGTRVVAEFTGFPFGYDVNDPETWNACNVRTLSPTWPSSPTTADDTRNTAYAQVPTVKCSQSDP